MVGRIVISSRKLLKVIAVAVLVVGATVASVSSAVAADDCGPIDCSVDVAPADDGFIGTGGLVLPRSFVSEETSREAAASCPDCEWMVVPVCTNNEAPDTVCAAATNGCPPDQLAMRVLRRVPPQVSWNRVGLICVGEGNEPVPVADVVDSVRDRFVDRVPPPEPAFQPAGGGLTNLPVIFRSGQAGGVRSEEFDLLGLPVVVDASPSWTWRWGDGSDVLRTTDAGSRWPDTEVSHVFTHAGRYEVQVGASWSGTFTVDGLGPFDVDGGPVTQEATLVVVVRDAPAELVD